MLFRCKSVIINYLHDFLYRKSVLCISLAMRSIRQATVPFLQAFNSIVILTFINAALACNCINMKFHHLVRNVTHRHVG